MDRKQTLIIIFVAVLFGSQIMGMSWEMVKGILGIVLSLVVLNLLSPESYQMITRYVPILEVFSWKNISNTTGTFFKNTGNFVGSINEEYCKEHCKCNSEKK